MFPENKKLNNLKERINDVAKNEKNGLLIIPMGVFLFFAGLIFGTMANSSLEFVAADLVISLGIFSTVFGFYVAIHYAHQHNYLLRELERIE